MPTDPAGFTSFAQQTLSSMLPSAKIGITEPLTLAIELPDHSKATLSLDNIYSFCRRDPDHCDQNAQAWFKRMAASTTASQQSADKSMLRVAVRPDHYLDGLVAQLTSKSNTAALVQRPIAGNLRAVVVLDYPTAVSPLVTSRLGQLGVDEETSFTLGQANSVLALPVLRNAAHQLEAGQIGMLGQDPYAASYILQHDGWGEIASRMSGPLLVSVPGTDMLLYANGAGPQAVDALATLTMKVYSQAERPLSLQVFQWTVQGWIVVR